MRIGSGGREGLAGYEDTKRGRIRFFLCLLIVTGLTKGSVSAEQALCYDSTWITSFHSHINPFER